MISRASLPQVAGEGQARSSLADTQFVSPGAVNPNIVWGACALAVSPYSPGGQFALDTVTTVAMVGLAVATWPLLQDVWKPLKSFSRPSRRRIGHLAFSGERIVDPSEATIVRAYVRGMLRWVDSLQNRLFVWFAVPLWLLSSYAYPAAVNASYGERGRAISGAVVLLAWLVGWVFMLRAPRRIHRTAVANDWLQP